MTNNPVATARVKADLAQRKMEAALLSDVSTQAIVRQFGAVYLVAARHYAVVAELSVSGFAKRAREHENG